MIRLCKDIIPICIDGLCFSQQNADSANSMAGHALMVWQGSLLWDHHSLCCVTMKGDIGNLMPSYCIEFGDTPIPKETIQELVMWLYCKIFF